MRKPYTAEEHKTKRAIISGTCKIIATALGAIITAIATVVAVIITIKNNPPPIPPSDSSELSSIVETAPESKKTEEPEALCDTSVLYDGESYLEYKYSSETFSIGSQQYNCGFTIKSPNPDQESSSKNGFVLMDLGNKYSKVSFSVGRVEGDSNSNATLVIYIDNKYVKGYRLQGKSSSEDIEIEVLNAKNLRLELKAEKDNEYGFADFLLHK